MSGSLRQRADRRLTRWRDTVVSDGVFRPVPVNAPPLIAVLIAVFPCPPRDSHGVPREADPVFRPILVSGATAPGQRRPQHFPTHADFPADFGAVVFTVVSRGFFRGFPVLIPVFPHRGHPAGPRGIATVISVTRCRRASWHSPCSLEPTCCAAWPSAGSPPRSFDATDWGGPTWPAMPLLGAQPVGNA